MIKNTITFIKSPKIATQTNRFRHEPYAIVNWCNGTIDSESLTELHESSTLSSLKEMDQIC